MNKEEFIQFVAKNLKYHLPSDFNSYQIEVNHMRLTISESNSSKQLNVYLNRAYEQFVQARSMFPIMENVAKNIAEKWSLMSKRTEEKRQAVNLVNNYNEAKKYLQAILCDPDMSAIAQDRVTTKAERILQSLTEYRTQLLLWEFLFWIILLLEEIRSSSLFGKTMFSHIQMISSMCPTCQNYNGHNK